MAHPMNEFRQSKVEKSRVGHITKGYASGGAVHSDEKQDRKLIRKMVGEMVPEGERSKHRADRPKRAKGGRVKGNGKTIINVITGGHPATGTPPPAPPMPPMGVASAGAMPPPRPPMTLPPSAGPGMPPPMPMRARGGRVEVSEANSSMPGQTSDAPLETPRGGGTKVFNESRRDGTHVSNTPGKNDISERNLDRPRVVTFKTGGGVKSFKVGGRVESPEGVAKASKLPGGAGGGEARLTKAHRQARK